MKTITVSYRFTKNHEKQCRVVVSKTFDMVCVYELNIGHESSRKM